MSGHNKWSKIKHKKAVTDAQKSKIFSKYTRLISVESKKAGGDVNSPSLKTVIENARKENMPSDNIQRAVQKGIGENAETLEEVIYETYGPCGVAIIMEGLTDNNNRTSSEIKHLLSQHNCSLASPGSAAWAFEKKDGVWAAQSTTAIPPSERDTFLSLVEALEEHEDIQSVYTNAE